MTQHRDPWLLVLACRVYALVLLAYPPTFRRAFRTEMAEVFRDVAMDALHARGRTGLLAIFARALLNLAPHVIHEYAVAVSRSRGDVVRSATHPLYWFLNGVLLGSALVERATGGVIATAVAVVLIVLGVRRVGFSGSWALLVGFGGIPALVFGHMIATSLPPCPYDPSWPGKPCIDPLAGQRIGVLVCGFLTVIGLCLSGGRRLELTAGVLSGLGCVGSGVYAAFWAIASGHICTDTENTSHCIATGGSFWQTGQYADVAFALFAGTLAGLVISGCAYIHSRHGESLGLAGLWIIAILMLGFSVLGAASFGVFTILPAVFTLVASLAGTSAQLRSRALLLPTP